MESVAGSNEQMILSAGMDVRAPAVASTDPPAQPQGLTPTAGDHDGEIDLSWDTVTLAKSYVIEQSGDPVSPDYLVTFRSQHAIQLHRERAQQRFSLLVSRRRSQ